MVGITVEGPVFLLLTFALSRMGRDFSYVIDLSEIRGLLRKYFDSPGRFCTTGHFAMFRALYLRLTGSVYVPVKNVVFLMLRTLTRLSILNQ